MQNESSINVRTGKLLLRTFGVFGIVLLAAVGSTWWFTKKYFDQHTINDKVFLELDSSIATINRSLIQDNKNEYIKMQSRLKRPELRENLILWKPRLDAVLRMGFTMHQFIEKTKQDMFMHSHDANSNEYDFKRVADSLVSFKDQLINILPENEKAQLSFLPIATEPVNIIKNGFYRNLSDSGRMAVLSKIEFSNLQSVNRMAHLMNEQMCILYIEYDQFDVLIGQNSTYLLPGQTLEVSAGLGTYSVAPKPFITMNGQSIAVNENGVATYKKLITAKDSTGKINVSVSFKEPKTGFIKSKTTILDYVVFQSPKK